MTCSRCGINGLHACPGAPIPPWTEEDKQRFSDALGRMFNWESSAMQKPKVTTVDPEVLPEIAAKQVWCCSEGCGECRPVQAEFEYASTTDLKTGLVTERTVGQVWVSACCKADLMLWDKTKDNFVDFEIKVPEVAR